MALFDPTEGLEELLSLNNLMLNSAKLVAVSQGYYIARLVVIPAIFKANAGFGGNFTTCI